MNNKGNVRVFKNDTLTLVKTEKEGYWLYDSVRGMNISMRAKTEQDAFVEALMYYQKRMKVIELELSSLKDKVDSFVNLFIVDDEDE